MSRRGTPFFTKQERYHKIKNWAREICISNICKGVNLIGFFCFILNLEKLNKKFEHKKFKMETIGTVIKLVRSGMFIAKLDRKDAYYNIPMLESHQKYLNFNYNNELYPLGKTTSQKCPEDLPKRHLELLRRSPYGSICNTKGLLGAHLQQGVLGMYSDVNLIIIYKVSF